MSQNSTLSALLRENMTVAVGDGLGAPSSLSRELSQAASRLRGVRLVLGWVPVADAQLDFGAFADARTFMPGWGLRRAVDAGQVAFTPARMSAVPALLHGPWRPDLLVTTLVRSGRGYRFGTEVSWQRAAVAAGALVAAVISGAAPCADAGEPLPADQVVVVGETSQGPAALPGSTPGPAHDAIASLITPLVPAGGRLQVGPSPVATALLRALAVPVRIDTGLLPAAVTELDARGLLAADPIAAYLAGGPAMHRWAEGRPLLHPIEYTHDPGRLSAEPLFAVNTAIEIDLDGQVNVEGTAASVLGGIGGHPDYAAAAARSQGGLSIVALTSVHRGRPTLVTRLSRPVSTPSHDVDMVVTERGLADLRGLSRPERRLALQDLWGLPSRPDRAVRARCHSSARCPSQDETEPDAPDGASKPALR